MNKSLVKILDRLATLKHLPSEVVLDDPRDPRSEIQLPRQQLSLALFMTHEFSQDRA